MKFASGAIMADEKQLREEICYAGFQLERQGLIAGTDGNLSALLPDGTLLITPSGARKGMLIPENLLVIDMDGNVLKGDGKPSVEFRIHLEFYKGSPSTGAVVHAHNPMVTAATLAGIDMTEAFFPEVVIALGGVPTVPYATATTPKLADAIRPYVKNHAVLALERHGAVAAAQNPIAALNLIEKAEIIAKTLIFAHVAGSPRPLSDIEKAILLKRREELKGTQPSP